MTTLIPPLVLPLELEAEPALPVVCVPGHRTPAALHQVAEALATQERYMKRDVTGDHVDETFCNFFVREALRMLGISIPRMRANDFAAWFSGRPDWAALPLWVGKPLVERGYVIVATQQNPAGAGHVALLMPPKSDLDRDWAEQNRSAWIAQAGRSNFAYGHLFQGFNPSRQITLFVHP